MAAGIAPQALPAHVGKHQREPMDEVVDSKNFVESSPPSVETMTGKEERKQQREVTGTFHILLIDLKSCSMRKDLQWGRRIHVKAVESRHDSNVYVVMALMRMYAKCRSMVDARCMFDKIQKPNLVCWNILLLGYAENGDGLAALELFSRMKAFGCAIDSVTYLAALKACTVLGGKRDGSERAKALKRGRQIHSEIGCHLSIFVQSALIGMYAKCGSMLGARLVFEGIQKPDVVCWNALILGYAENGDGLTTLDLFSRMKACGCSPNAVTYIAALKACTYLAGKRDAGGQVEWLKRGKEIHSDIGSDLDIFVQSTLIDMYGKCGSMVDARRVFESIQKPNVVCWNTLLSGYTQNGDGLATLELFSKMKACGYAPDSITYVATLKACTTLAGKGDGQGKFLTRGREIHSEIGSKLDIFIQNTLIDMYANCGSMADAHRVFDGIQKPNLMSWTALLLGYAENGDGLTTLELFSRMQACGFVPDSVAYIAAFKACASLAGKRDGVGQGKWLEQGKQIHSEIACDLSIFLQSTLIDMYTKCGSMSDARQVFDNIYKPDVVCWNGLLMGYAENGYGRITLGLLSKMKASGCEPNSVTYVAALKACTSLTGNQDGDAECLRWGRDIHSQIGCHSNNFVQNTLIDMYAKCGSIFCARQVFDSIQDPEVVTWNVLLLGYAENGDGLGTLRLFSMMKACGCAPDCVTYIASLKACGIVGALVFGRELHSQISEFTSQLITCLVDFYAKCGSIIEAHEVFDAHWRARDVATWTALLTGYASFGDSAMVFKLFEALQDHGFQPNAVTFVCLLSCCSRAGLVEKAREYFEAMTIHYGITPTVMHYTCMVDVLGRVNKLNEAVAMLQKIPCKADVVTCMTLLGACRKWKNVEIGRRAFKTLVDMDKKNTHAHVLMAHIFSSREMWEEQERMLELRIMLDG